MRSLLVLLAFLASCGGAPARTEAPAPEPVVAAAEPAQPAGPPLAEVRPVTNTYHGVDVVDPYQWLEDPSDPEVRAWSDAQNRHARAYLAGLPNLDRVREQVRAILAAPTRSHYAIVARGDRLFALEDRPPREQPLLVVLTSPDDPDSARTVFDPTTVDAEGGVSMDWFEPSPDGRLVAISLSRGGSERGDVHVFDVASGERVGEIIEHVNGGTAGGDLAWMPDSSGFFYTRYPREGERPAEDVDFYQQLWFHRMGTPVSEDRYELGRDFPASRRSSCRCTRRAAACSRRCRTATAASSRCTCASATAAGANSRASTTRSCRRASGPRTISTSSRGRARRAGRSCASRSRASTSRAPRSSYRRVRTAS
ncbi:MAG: hypothetical protein M5U28_41870 [Sandaracinaceae bacterium]|nr:hypothetical protein [Sandaracinaceae bacterium]